MNIQLPNLFQKLFGKLLWRKSPSMRVIYLTLDDGPVPEVTPLVLDILDKYNVKATFFSVGQNVEKYPDLYADILHRGHRVGNHTYNHLKGIPVSTAQYVENVKKASKFIDSNLFRPPYGQIGYSQARALSPYYEIVMWDVITHDYNQSLSAETVFKNVTRYSRNGSIVVFHDSVKAKENVLVALPMAIEFWKREGYSFGVL